MIKRENENAFKNKRENENSDLSISDPGSRERGWEGDRRRSMLMKIILIVLDFFYGNLFFIL